MATGSAATEAAPAARAAQALPGLLLRVRTANGGWRGPAADHARDGEESEYVREHLGENLDARERLPVGVPEPEGERGREAEQARRGEGAERPPRTEDDRRQRDEAAPRGHVLVEAA